MALSRAKYRRVTELYTPGSELELLEGEVLWLKALNPFERDEAQRDAQLARSRLVLALKGPHAEEELVRVQAQFLQDGVENAVDVLAGQLANEKIVGIINSMRDDLDWREKIELIERQESLASAPATEAEVKQLADMTTEYLDEVSKRIEAERDYQQQRLKDYDEVALLEEYIDLYITSRGNAVATAEFSLTEAWYAARVCEGVKLDDGTWDHGACEGHKVQIFETKQEMREAPEVLQSLITNGMRSLSMNVREARFLDSPGSSSDSSAPPSEAEGSTASSPAETPATAPGT